MSVQFTASRDALARELAIIAGSAERRSNIPILQNIRIEATADGLRLEATNLEISCSAPCPATVTGAGSFTVPARRFLDYIRALPDGGVAISVGANQWVSITAGSSMARIAGMGAEAWPELPKMPEFGSATLPAEAFARLVKQVAYAISQEESRFTLNGALIESVDGVLKMVATDGHRLALSSAPFDGKPFKALVPRLALLEARKVADTASSGAVMLIAIDDSNIFFAIEGRVITARLMSGNFPDYQRVLPRDHTGRFVINRMVIASAISRVAGFSDERFRCIQMSITPNAFTVAASSAEIGDSEESAPIEAANVVPLAVGVNAKYILEALGSIDVDEVELAYRDGSTAIMITAIAAHVPSMCAIMPMRL